MNIKGIYKTSLIDYPGKICSIIFIGGCNLRCRYCHNPDLATNSKDLRIYTNEETLNFLRKRQGLIDGITLSGGEPTLPTDLEDFIYSVKKIPLSVKIDTNGLNPDIIENLLNKKLLDYVSVDVKTSPDKYEQLVRKKIDFSRIIKTIKLLKNSAIDFEIRTTCIPDFVALEDFQIIKNEIGKVKRYYLQQYINKVTLDPSLQEHQPYHPSVLKKFRDFVQTFSEICQIRGI